MAATTGIGGSVTIAGGYTTCIKQWSVNIVASPQEFRKLVPDGGTVESDNWVSMQACPTFSGSGTMVCELHASCTADATGLTLANPSGWTVTSECEAIPYVVLGDQWTYNTAGYKSGTWEVRGVSDATTNPDEVGEVVTPVLTSEAGSTYTITDGVITGVSVTNGQGERETVISGTTDTDGVITAATLPLAGVTGAATFKNSGGIGFSGNILITSITATVDRSGNVPVGSITANFVFNGEVSEE